MAHHHRHPALLLLRRRELGRQFQWLLLLLRREQLRLQQWLWLWLQQRLWLQQQRVLLSRGRICGGVDAPLRSPVKYGQPLCRRSFFVIQFAIRADDITNCMIYAPPLAIF